MLVGLAALGESASGVERVAWGGVSVSQQGGVWISPGQSDSDSTISVGRAQHGNDGAWLPGRKTSSQGKC